MQWKWQFVEQEEMPISEDLPTEISIQLRRSHASNRLNMWLSWKRQSLHPNSKNDLTSYALQHKNMCLPIFRYLIWLTDSIKINRPGHNIRMCWANFWQPTVHVQQNTFEKTPIEAVSSHLCASFGTFCVQIGQFLEAQWLFELCLKIDNLLSSKENVGDLKILPNVPIWSQKVLKEA